MDGEPVGPVVGYTRAELEQLHKKESVGVPFHPDRPRRWVTRSQAIALAREIGAEFRESRKRTQTRDSAA